MKSNIDTTIPSNCFTLTTQEGSLLIIAYENNILKVRPFPYQLISDFCKIVSQTFKELDGIKTIEMTFNKCSIIVEKENSLPLQIYSQWLDTVKHKIIDC